MPPYVGSVTEWARPGTLNPARGGVMPGEVIRERSETRQGKSQEQTNP
jgi:hypothetical protein